MRLLTSGVLRRVLVLLVALATVWGHSSTALAQDVQKRVLTLYATRRDAQVVVIGDRVLQETLSEALPGGVDYYSEYLDQGRFFDTDYQRAFGDSLALKYARYQFDVVVAVGRVPLEFVAKLQSGMFSGVPVVYFVDSPVPRTVPNSTGLLVQVDLKRTVTFARALQPDLKHLFVVSGVNATMSAARQPLLSSDLQLDVTTLSGLSTQALEGRLRTLPPQSMVLYLTVDRIGPDQNFRPLDYLDRISAVANAPVYSWVDSALGHGIVGGSLKSQEEEFRALGALALRVLRGESPDSIPVSSPDLDVKLADWREMQRWGLSASRLPSGTQVRFRELSIWDQYKVYIVAIVAGLLAQTALISALLLQRRQRRRAERQVLRNQSALRSSYDKIRYLGGRLLVAQDAERARIARELHDDIGQQLVLLDVELQSLQTHPDMGVTEALAVAAQRIATIQRSAHDLSHRLHPAKLRLIGLVASIESLQRDFSQSGVAVTFDKTLVQDSFPPDLTVCVFRVVQEALQNALKHGGARTIAIALDTTNGLSLRIDDDGSGFDVDAAWNRGLGLLSMRERVEALGGTIAIHSRRTAGTKIEVRMPLPAVADQASLAG